MTFRISMAALALLFSAAGAMAQRPQHGNITPQQRAEQMTQRMTEQLSLSDEQAGKIEQIYLKNFEQMKQSAEERSQRIQKADDQIKQVLTAEQREQWEQKQAQVRERMKQRGQASRQGHGMRADRGPQADSGR